MSGCLDNAHCECIGDLSEKRNGIAAVTAGALFFIGWWLIIGNAAEYPAPDYFNNAYYACGVIGTLAFFMINAVSNSQVRGDAMTTGVLGTRGARLWLLIGFVLGFGALIASIWILFAAFVVDGEQRYKKSSTPGVLLFLENFFIFAASLIYKFGRTEDNWG